ncbi:hypothetical protein ACLOJK_027130 [Asimina triloba]
MILGETALSNFIVNQILRQLTGEWPGISYDLLSKNCNHFCDELCERLGVPKLPAMMLELIFVAPRLRKPPLGGHHPATNPRHQYLMDLYDEG